MAAPKLKWTEATRKQLHAFRSSHPKDPVDAHQPVSPEAAWETLRAVNGEVTADEPHRELLERVRAQMASPSLPEFEPNAELFRAAYVTGLGPAGRDWASWDDWAIERALVALWSRAAPAALLELLLHQGRFWTETGSVWMAGSTTQTLRFASAGPVDMDPPLPPFAFRQTFSQTRYGVWSALRGRVDFMDAAAFEQANAAAHEARMARPTDDSYGRAMIAFAFARDPAHALEECRAPQVFEGLEACFVLLASASIDEAGPVVERIATELETYGGCLHQVAYDLVETFGRAAAPLLARAVDAQNARKTTVAMRKASLRPLQGALKVLG